MAGHRDSPDPKPSGPERSGERFPGQAVQRESQLQRRRVALEESAADFEREEGALRSQFLDLANRHQFEGLDPIGSAPIPFTDLVQDRESRDFRRYSWYAGIVGTVVAGGLFAATIAAPSSAVLPIGVVLTGLLGGVFVGVVTASTLSGPRNPDSFGTLIRWSQVWGALTAASLFGILWLRFVSDATTLERIAIPIAVLEISLYALCGTFAAIATNSGWSRWLTVEFRHVRAARIAVDEELAAVSVELMEFEFQRSLKTGSSKDEAVKTPKESVPS